MHLPVDFVTASKFAENAEVRYFKIIIKLRARDFYEL